MKKGIFLVAILLLPSVVYLLFSLGRHNTAKLKSYGAIVSVEENGDTIFQSVHLPQFEVANQAAKEQNWLDGKTLLIHRISNPCEEGCVDGIATLNNYLNKVGLTDKWLLISVASEQMDSEEIDLLSRQNLYKGGNWHFARTSQMQALLDQLYVKSGRASSIDEVVESEVVLIDQNRIVRGFFDLKFQQDNKKLQDAIKVLIQEPHISWKENRKK